MPKLGTKKTAKLKPIHKSKQKQIEDDFQEDEEDFHVDDVLHEEPYQKDMKLEKIESAEEVRKRLANEVIAKYAKKESALKDDFFMVEGEEESKREGEEGGEYGEKLKQEYLRKQNRLYEAYDDKYAVNGFEQGIEYKGHTRCITAFELTNQSIYSCSKDRSIIHWNRQTKQKRFISWGKQEQHHKNDILCLALHYHHNLLATAGEDCMIKLWDTRTPALIQTLRGHKNNINGLKFGVNSNTLCSVSSDLTLKQWDISQRGLIETFYEHNREVLDIDCFNNSDFITSANDHQVITWKTQKETKVIFKGHDYAIDRVRSINFERFVTACQDGSIYLWNCRKIKPVFKMANAHPKGWISAMDNIKQTNVLATAGIDRTVKIWGIEGEAKGLKLMREIEIKGIVTDLKMSQNVLGVTECDELRLGRWITDKCRNKIKLFRVKNC